ncbi:DNA polymerase III subunit delta' [Ancylobacter dichloromethanicus]|uniref:DNA polymerase III subunit delta n=1 Tax=Ancylobacter dichloromethanicus TaxID=518825 RepID=A0A9W6MYW9_9HYPH|nr:DNA polymerase III subunit delta' [Ancylobacter dichloromethanicus]MBS7554346.1 DNA polymerase III subunit delta' [Ancylobacter dichloromethanicus]GLK71471.1 DNA polymerase III subunit delta' [Ancylobacter dichloromethanicus]
MKDAAPLEGDRFGTAPAPRETAHLIGHEEAQAMVRTAWDAGRLPHALLLGGAEGIGKATLAYTIARFVLSGGAAPAHAIDVDPGHPAARQVAALSHPDLLVLRRTPNDAGKLPSMIPAETVRRVRSFFGSTAALGGWRVCIVDTLDEMNAQGANALLKTLEEPPTRSLFLLVSHAPGRLLPTIRSRCRMVPLRALTVAQVVEALETLSVNLPALDRSRFPEAAEASGGSVREALALLEGDGLAVRNATKVLLDALSEVEPKALHALGERLQGDRGGALASFVGTVEGWISDHATGRRQTASVRLARLPEVWEKVRRAAVDAEVYNLDRKTLVFRIFASLNEALRP